MKNGGKVWTVLGLAAVLLFAGCMTLFLPNGFAESQSPVAGAFSGGNGSIDNPFLIGDLTALNGNTAGTQFRGHVNANLNSTVYYKLTNDIDLSSISNWTPIPRFGPNMVLDGAGGPGGRNWEIRNLKNTGTGSAQGFIANLQGTVKNITFTNVSMTGNGNLRGVVAATVDRTATSGAGSSVDALIDNVHVTGGVVTGVRAGGLVGAVGVTAGNANGSQTDANSVKLTVSNSSNNAAVGISVTAGDSTAANSGVGGLVGYVRRANLNITGSSNTGTITVRSSAKHVGLGGLVGMVNDAAPTNAARAVSVNINSSYNSGVVSFTRNSIEPINNSTSTANAGVRNNWQATGGFIGLLFSSSSANNNDAIVSNAAYRIKLNISGCYNTGLIQCFSTATSDIRATAGGFIGLTGGVGPSANPAVIKNSYNTGSIRAISLITINNQGSTSNAAGMIGFMDTSAFRISSCYNTGEIFSRAIANSGNSSASSSSLARANCGGIIGDQNGSCVLTIENSANSGTLTSTQSGGNARANESVISTYGIGPSSGGEHGTVTHTNNLSTTGTGPGSGAGAEDVANLIDEINDIILTETLGAVYIQRPVIANFTYTASGYVRTDAELGDKVYKGETYTFTVAPAIGYTLAAVEIGGVPQSFPNGNSAANTWTIPNLQEDTAVTVTVDAIQYTITLEPNNGSAEEHIIGSIGASISADEPQKVGYTFEGWFEDNGEWQEEFDFSVHTTMPARNVDLYAKWEPLTGIAVTYNGNKGAGSTTPGAPSSAGKTVTFDSAYGALATISRDGYIFAGWWTSAVGGSEVTAETVVNNPANHTLYAHWTAVPTIEVTFDGNKGAGSTTPGAPSFARMTVVFDSEYGELAAISRVGYMFAGWRTAAVGGSEVTAATSVRNFADHTLYAHWTAVSTIEVTYNGNGGIPSLANQTVTFDSEYGELATADMEGYTFEGWWADGAEVTADTIVRNPENHSLAARWVGVPVLVTFDVNKGTGSTTPETPSPAAMTVTYRSVFGELPTTRRNGYEFNGWWTAADDGIEVTESMIIDSFEGLTLYAHWQPVLITVTFDGNRGDGSTMPSEPMNIPVMFDSEYGTLMAGIRDGYTFAGWWTSAVGGSAVTAATIVRDFENHTLFAHWTADSITVNFDSNGGIFTSTGGMSISPAMLAFDAQYGTLPEVTLEHNNFGGWWTRDGSSSNNWGTQVLSSNNVTDYAEHTLYAKWNQEDQYTIMFYTNGGTPVPSITGYADESITNPALGADFKRAGYTFAGWFEDSGEWQDEFDFSVNTEMPARNVNLYAKWEPLTDIDVTFDGNKGAGSTAPGAASPVSKTVTFDSSYGALAAISRNGYVFSGWWTSAVGGSEVTASTVVSNYENHTLYAHWTALSTIAVAFDGNKADGSTTPEAASPAGKTVIFDSSYGALAAISRNGYTFAGWWTSAVGGSAVTAATVVSNYENHTLFAHWTAVSAIVVTFDGNRGVGSTTPEAPSLTSKTVTFDSEYGALAAISRDGYAFAGWWTSAVGGNKVTDVTSVSSFENHTLYAHWTAVSTIAVTFDGNKGTGSTTPGAVSPADKTVTFDSAYEALASVNRDGYTFAGWWTLAAGGSEVTAETVVSRFDNHTLFAHWTAKVTVVVTFDGNKGTGSTTPGAPSSVNKTVTFDSEYGALSTITRNGYVFAGWWTSSVGGSEVTAATSVGNFDNHTIYAHWTAVSTISVAFDGNKGDGSTEPEAASPTDKAVTFDSGYGELAVISRGGYAFAGWWTSAVGGDLVTAATEVSSFVNHTLYAHWTAITTIVVTFDGNKGEGSTTPGAASPVDKTVTFDSGYGELSAVSRDGYTFAGWRTAAVGGDLVTRTTVVSSFANHTLYAHWIANSYTITFNSRGGSAVAPVTQTFDMSVSAPTPPTRIGHTFDAWYGDEELNTPFAFGTSFTVAADITLFAKWIVDEPIVCAINIHAVNAADGSIIESDIYGAAEISNEQGKNQFILWEAIQQEGYSFAGYAIISGADLPYASWQGIFGQFSDGFMWLNMAGDFPDELLHDNSPNDPYIVIYAYYNTEYNITLKNSALLAEVEVYVSYWTGEAYRYYTAPWAESGNSFAAGSDIRIEVNPRGNYELEFYLDDAGQKGERVSGFVIDGEGAYGMTLSESAVYWVEVKLASVTLVKETLTKTLNGNIRGGKEDLGNKQIDTDVWQTVNLASGNTESGTDFITWYLSADGELLDIASDSLKDCFVMGESNSIEKMNFFKLKDYRNRSNEIVLIALFSEKINLSISVSDNAPLGHNMYELWELADGKWVKDGELFSETDELLTYGTKYRIVPFASKFYNFDKFDGVDLSQGDAETAEYLELTLTADRNITLNFSSKEFTMIVTNTTSDAKGVWSYEEELKFRVEDSIIIAFDVASLYQLNKMTLGTKNVTDFAESGMVFRNGTLTIDVTVEWLEKAFGEGWLDLTNPAACKFDAKVGAETPLSTFVVVGGSVAGVIAVAVGVMIVLSLISIKRKKQAYAAALVKHREGMARLKQNIVGDLLKDL